MSKYPIILKDVRQIKDYEHNSRTHPQDQVEQLKALINLVGFTSPLLIDDVGIIAGHGRKIAALQIWESGNDIFLPSKKEKLPKWKLPTIKADGLTDDERRAFVIADNQVANNSAWDKITLAQELHALSSSQFDLGVLGFDQSYMADLINLPDFKPVIFNAGTRLDEKSNTVCPNCKHEWQA